MKGLDEYSIMYRAYQEYDQSLGTQAGEKMEDACSRMSRQVMHVMRHPVISHHTCAGHEWALYSGAHTLRRPRFALKH